MSPNQPLVEMFNRMADVLLIRGENAFKAIAFQKVARTLDETPKDIAQVARVGELPHIEGVGESSRHIIEEFARKGHSETYEELLATVPSGLLEMLQIPGLGPKTIALLWKQKEITSVAQLESAAQQGGLDGIKGIGAKKVAAILDGIRILKTGMQRRGWMDAQPLVQKMLIWLQQDKRIGQSQVAGSYRRHKETVGDVDLLCWVHDPADAPAITQSFSALPGVVRVLGCGETKCSVLMDQTLQVDLRVVPRESYGAALQYFTGSKQHNVKLRGLANDKGLTLNEWGLYRRGEKKPMAGETEEGIYQVLGLDYIEPELREDRDEIAAAALHKLPVLLTEKDIRGDLHCHTTASDGNATILEMAEAARQLGYEYLAITDHSQSSIIANGLKSDRLLKHIGAIHKAQEQIKGITLLAGTEVDILADGHLDYDAAILKDLDFVVASAHTALKQDPAKATQRLLKVMDTRYVNLIGHPTGRMINQRDGLPLQMEQIFTAAAQTGTALEINAGWPRWDLNDVHARMAWQQGAMLAINTDAHSTQGLQEIEKGLWIARRAAVPRKQVLNCLKLDELRKFLQRKR